MSIRFRAGQYPRVLTMMEEGMTYTEYERLRKEDPRTLLELFYFVIERRLKEREELNERLRNEKKGMGTRYVAP